MENLFRMKKGSYVLNNNIIQYTIEIIYNSRNISDCSHFLILVSIRTALLTNIKFGEGCCLFFAMFIVKIRLHKVILNFHRRMARDVSRVF